MSKNPLEIFSRLNIMLITELDEQGMGLLRQVQRTRARVEHRWPVPEKIGDNTDIVICEYSPDLSRRYAWMPGEAAAAVIVLMPSVENLDLSGLKAATPDAVLHRPYRWDAVSAAMIVAWDHFSYVQRQRTRISRLDENVRSLRQIERAKHIIMRQKNISESNALSELRSMAMSRRMSMAALASQLIDTQRSQLAFKNPALSDAKNVIRRYGKSAVKIVGQHSLHSRPQAVSWGFFCICACEGKWEWQSRDETF